MQCEKSADLLNEMQIFNVFENSAANPLIYEDYEISIVILIN